MKSTQHQENSDVVESHWQLTSGSNAYPKGKSFRLIWQSRTERKLQGEKSIECKSEFLRQTSVWKYFFFLRRIFIVSFFLKCMYLFVTVNVMTPKCKRVQRLISNHLHLIFLFIWLLFHRFICFHIAVNYGTIIMSFWTLY